MPGIQKEEVSVAPQTLLTREILPIKNWHEWLARWEDAKDFQWMESLLHVGFTIPLEKRAYGEKEYDEVDRNRFYLSIADGWADARLLELPTDGDKRYLIGYNPSWNRIEKTLPEIRQQLAQKAFKMLCLNFFKVGLTAGGDHGDEFNQIWQRSIVSERLFPSIQHFFRVVNNGSSIPNLSSWRKEELHAQEEAVAFLVKLAKFMWGWREPTACHYDSDKEQAMQRFASMRARIDVAKPWMIEVLVSLKYFEVVRARILQLDQACLAKLREIALRNELRRYIHPVAKDRLVATVDEACFAGSEAAWLIKEHELMIRENNRLKAIREAEERKEAAEEEIEGLTVKE
jgi:hypothetical protein